MKRTTGWLLFCAAVLAGLALVRVGFTFSLKFVPILSLVWLAGFRRSVIWRGLLILTCGFLIGWWRGSVYAQKLAQFQPYYDHKITLTVTAQNDGVYNAHKQMSFDASKIQINDQHLTGKLEVSGFGLNSVFQGDELQVTGRFASGLGQYQGFMSYAQLELVAHHPSLIAEVRRKFAAGMQTALPEPLASFAMGLLIGQRATLPTEVKQTLLMVGLTHIIAVSGYNLTIILEASRGLFAKRSKRLTTLFSLGLMIGFLLLAGASASIVRAAIVSMLSIWAEYYGRPFRPLLLILLAAAITAWANPYYLWSDTSWYLSFLAFYGVLAVAPTIHERWFRRWKSVLIGVAIESISAELMTLPFILFTFGQMSFIGLPANVLVVTLVPLAMLLSAIAGLAGMFFGNLAGWFTWPANLLLNYMLDVAQLLSRVPHIFKQQLGFSRWQMLASYAVVVGTFALLAHKTKAVDYATITDKK